MEYNYYNIYYPDYLMHYGVKGMKWGHRRARSQAYVDASNRAQMAKAQYKQAKVDARAAAKAERNTPEAKAARKAKAAKAAKIGAAVAGTALAAYGAYKLNQYVKTKNGQIAAKRGANFAAKEFEALQNSMSWDTNMTSGRIRYDIGAAARSAANDASTDNFRTAARNVIDYKRSGGSLQYLRPVNSYDGEVMEAIFEGKKRK